jgi:hypothetical protein
VLGLIAPVHVSQTLKGPELKIPPPRSAGHIAAHLGGLAPVDEATGFADNPRLVKMVERKDRLSSIGARPRVGTARRNRSP